MGPENVQRHRLNLKDVGQETSLAVGEEGHGVIGGRVCI